VFRSQCDFSPAILEPHLPGLLRRDCIVRAGAMGKAPETRNELLSSAAAEQAEDVCRRFQAACQAGKQPRIEDYLAEVSQSGRAAVLRRLLVLEFGHRSAVGETCVLDEYCQRFPGETKLIHAAFREAAGASEPPAPGADSAQMALADT